MIGNFIYYVAVINELLVTIEIILYISIIYLVINELTTDNIAYVIDINGLIINNITYLLGYAS